jgi:putative spermidine/putrescine transport system permease protein
VIRRTSTVASLFRRTWRHESVQTWGPLAPALALVVVLFGGALGLALLRSLGPLAGGTGAGRSLDAYRRLLADTEFVRSLLLTLHVAVTSTVLAVVLGIGAALLLRRLVRGRRLATTVFQLNLPLPHVVGAVAILAILGQSGLLSRVAAQTGVIEGPASFPALVFDPYAIGIIVQYVWKEVPFIGIVALAILRSTGHDLEEAARTLGASPWQRLRHVIMPLLLPGVLSAVVIVFAFTFGTFEVPVLLGRSFPAVLPVLAHQRYTDVDLAARPEAMAISVVITVLVLVVVVAGSALARRTIRQEAR